jgi:hypothetical protein
VENCKLKISLKEQYKKLQISFCYRDYLKREVNFFSTSEVSSTTGFIRATPLNFYFKFTLQKYFDNFPKLHSDLDYVKISVDSKKMVINWGISYENAYQLIGQKLVNLNGTFKINELQDHYYELIILNEKQMKALLTKSTNNTQKVHLNRDFKYADKYRYSLTPNTDGNRTYNEYFAGSGSNIGGKKK